MEEVRLVKEILNCFLLNWPAASGSVDPPLRPSPQYAKSFVQVGGRVHRALPSGHSYLPPFSAKLQVNPTLGQELVPPSLEVLVKIQPGLACHLLRDQQMDWTR